MNFDLTGVVFDGGDFTGARFSSGTVRFGGTVDFSAVTEFADGTADFTGAIGRSRRIPWTGTPPPGVKLPKKEDQSQV